jgi:hypothetical protein
MYRVDDLIKVIGNFHKEAGMCFQNKCYIASLILYGSILEAMLLSMCFVYPQKVRTTQVYKKRKKRVKRKKGIFLEFTLNELINIAEELQWFPMQEKIEDISIFKNWIKWVQETRNLVHPARWLKPDSHFGNIHQMMKGVSKKDLKQFVEISEETISGITSLFTQKVEQDLAQSLGCKTK